MWKVIKTFQTVFEFHVQIQKAGGPDTFCVVLVINVRTSLEKQLDPMGPIASRGVSMIPKFLRQPIATYDLLGGERSGPPAPPPPGSANEFFSQN